MVRLSISCALALSGLALAGVALAGTSGAAGNPIDDAAPSWSPNGKTIAFARGERIYLMGADGRHPHALITSPGVRDADPAWSPDGTRIAFVRREAGLGAALFLRAPAWKPVRS